MEQIPLRRRREWMLAKRNGSVYPWKNAKGKEWRLWKPSNGITRCNFESWNEKQRRRIEWRRWE